MSVINSENKDAWQALANEVSKQRPYVGRKVKIQKGKHKDKVGIVKIHTLSRFTDPFRYCSDAQAHLREMAGRFGFCCLVTPDDGTKEFWVDADNTICMD